jgi:hypothetical protein
MSSLGLNHSAWGPELSLNNANASASHYSGNFGSNTGAVTGCAGPCNGVDGASGKAGWQYNLGQKGGMSYSMVDPQPIHNFVPAQFKGYSNVGVDNPAKLGAGVQWTPKTGGSRRRKHKGGKVNYFYGFTGEGGNQGVFAGSGYPEITKSNQCGAGKRKSKHNKMRLNKSRCTRKHRHSKNCGNNRKTYKSKRFSKRSMKSAIFKGGNYAQYTGNQAYSNIYSMPGYPISPSEVGLAGAGNFAVKPVNCGAVPRV